MAKLDLKKTTIRLMDGKRATLTFDSVAANSDIVFTEVRTHVGTNDSPIRVRSVNPGTNNAALGITVAGSDITINLATDGSAAATTTATLAVAALAASQAAAALVSAVAEGSGAGLLSVIGYTALTGGPNTLEVKIGDGNLTYSEKRNIEYVKDKGVLDTVREGDEEPVDIKFDFTWEFLKAVTSSGAPTVEDVLKNVGEASTWVTSSDDPCEPFAVDLEIEYAPVCDGVDPEYIRFNDFRYEELAHDMRQGQVSASGKANITQAIITRG